MLPKIEKRSGGALRREEERFKAEERGEGPGSRSEGLRLPEREELRTGCGFRSEGLRLPEREELFLRSRFERVTGMAR